MQATEKILRIVLLALLCGTASGAAVAPDWMRQAATQTLPAYPPDTDAVTLLDEMTVSIQGPGDYIEHYRRVVKILRREGEHYGSGRAYYEHDEKVQMIHAWSMDAAGHEYEVKEKEFEEGNPLSFELYDDTRFKQAHLPAALPGTVVGIEWEIHRRHFLNQIGWWVQEKIPVRQCAFTVQLPPGWEYKTSWADLTPVEPLKTGDNRWQWTWKDVPRIEEEERMPAWGALQGRMLLTYFGPGQPSVANWKAIGNWHFELASSRRTSSPEIVEKVRELTAGKSAFDARVRALSSFLQAEIRYVAIEIGIGGFQPHYASDVFRSRYGDCKDKVALLSTMLREAGIRSQYFLISTYRGTVEPGMASPWFNHAIIAIEMPEGDLPAGYESVVTSASGTRYLLFDPTDEYTPAGQIRGDLQDSYGLLVSENGGELLHTPLLRPETNLLSRRGHFSLNPDGTLSGDVEESRTGDHAARERAYLAHANENERLHRIERRLNTSLKGFSVSDLSIRQPVDLREELKVSLKLTAQQYAQVRGPLLLVRPRVMGEKSFGIDHKPRHYAFEMSAPTREMDNFELAIPPGYKVDELPDGQDLDVGFATYHSKYEVVGDKIQYSREYNLKSVVVPAEKIEVLRNLEGRIGADEQSVVILKRAE